MAAQFNQMLATREEADGALRDTTQRLDVLSHRLLNIQETERRHIANELHDDIGSTLSGIAMYSHMTDGLLQSNEYGKAKDAVAVIQKSATEIVDKLGDLVWAINPGNHSFATMLEKLHHYGEEMCKAKNISFKTNMVTGHFNLPSENFYQLYLFCKEAINNAVKYSEAGLLALTVKETDGQLEISISDDGKGFDVQTIKRGNGLNNMQKRATELGGDFNMQSKLGSGCLISLKLKITQ